jgi:FkbM family methyltransferase
MEGWLRRNAVADARFFYDRQSGKLSGGSLIDQMAVHALQVGSVVTRPFGHRGYGWGCDVVSCAVARRDIVVGLNADARFAIPFCDRYWSRILNSHYEYEEEIETFLRNVADVKYTFVDCGANFGYWSVLASSEPFGGQTVLAIEASPDNAVRLALNAGLNGNRYRYMNAAIGGRTGGFVRVAGRRHEAFSTYAAKDDDRGAVRRVSLDGLLGSDLDAQAPTVIKLDVEGVEIEAVEGAKALLSGNSLVICEDHGSDRTHGVSRHLMNDAALSLYIFDPVVCRFVRVEGPAVLDRVKRYRWVGYNVFATRSPVWEDRLQSAQWICR